MHTLQTGSSALTFGPFFCLLSAALGCQTLLGIEELPPSVVGADGAPTSADARVCEGPEWWNSSFQKRVTVDFIDPTGLTGLTGIPLLVTLGPADVDYGDFTANGDDIRFVADGASVPYEIEKWDPEGQSLLWVRVPEIPAAGACSPLHMYYNNPGASAGADNDAVWDNSYEVVYHFAEDAAMNDVLDSSGSERNLSRIGTVSAYEQAPIGRGVAFPGDMNNALRLDNIQVLESVAGRTLTVETWFRSQNIQDLGHLFSMEGGCTGWRMYVWENAELHARAGNDPNDICGSGTEPPHVLADFQNLISDRWYHVTQRIERAEVNQLQVCMQLRYLEPNNENEMVQRDSCSVLQTDVTGDTTGGAPLLIGSFYQQTDTFLGQLDEFRISVGIRSTEWIDAQFLAATGNLVTVTNPESL